MNRISELTQAKTFQFSNEIIKVDVIRIMIWIKGSLMDWRFSKGFYSLL